MQLYLGIDFGTSGARAIVIDQQGNIQAETKCSYAIRDISTWQPALFSLIEQIPLEIRRAIRAIAIDGTSATVLLCDADGEPVPYLSQPLIYSDDRAAEVMSIVRSLAPEHSIVQSPTSSFAKLIWLTQNSTLENLLLSPHYFLHQADWLGFLLHGRLGVTDYHNALKLGYDVEQYCYPHWLSNSQIISLLPQVVVPSSLVGKVTSQIAERLKLHLDCWVCAGTTDSNAAFLSSASELDLQPGVAVTSLGSTLVLKVLSTIRIDDVRYGIYSHRFNQDLWLVGGASNTGGAVLRQFFSDRELQDLSLLISSDRPSPLDYYPLTKPGERFPIADPHLQPKLEPRPDHPAEFLHGILEGIAKIEAIGYQLLENLGAPPIHHVITCGGGAINSTWTAIRARNLGVSVSSAVYTEAAYGSALLARSTRLNLLPNSQSKEW